MHSDASISGWVVFVQSGEVGTMGGAAKATLLLCEQLALAGARVTLFVTLPPEPAIAGRLKLSDVALRTPAIPVGWRHAIPQRAIAAQLWLEAAARRPRFVQFVGFSREAREILKLPNVTPIYLWETTEAQPGNKFVDREVPALLHRAAAVVVPSTTIERNVRSTYGYTGSVRYLPYWAEDPEAGVPAVDRQSSCSPKLSQRILYFGRLDPDKGFEYLLPAFELVRRTHPDAALSICGGGNPASVPGLTSPPAGVSVLGQISSEELDREIRDASAVVLPSLHEGYPISLLEACGRSTPIVATSVGSIPEVFANRKCALIVPPKDVDALAEALSRILDEPPDVHEARRSDSRALFEEVSSPGVVRQMIAHAYA